MTISRESYDRTKRYRKVRFHQDRDLLDAELNEVQEIGLQERTRLFDALLPPGAIVRGIEPTVNGAQVTFTAGAVYLDGHLEEVLGTTLAYDPAKTTGVDTVWVEVLHKAISVADDPALINTQTGEPTAEREQWQVSLKSRDTATDPLPTGVTGRTTIAIYTFDRATGILTPCVAGVLRPDERIRLDAHIGHGGTDQHPAASTGQAGFLTAVDKSKLDTLSTTVPPTHIHDDRYYTESETDTKLAGKATTTHNHDTVYAPVSHVGASGAAHPGAAPGVAGFLSGTDKTKLDQLSTTTPPVHIHDDRYYVEAETDAKLATKADTTHNHDTIYTPLAHAGAGGAAHAAATTAADGFLSAADKTKLDTLSTTTPPTHTHDDRYFTETELGAMTGGSAGAGKIGVTPSGGISASNVQAALQELDTDKAAAGHTHDSAYAPLGHVGAAGGAHPAATETVAGFLSGADKAKLDSINITTPPDHTHDDRYYTETELSATTNGSSGATKIGVTPTGNLSTTSVQAALTELDTEKAATGHNHDAAYAPVGHVGAGGAAHAAATSGVAGFLAAADKTKLDALSTTIPPTHIHDDRYYTEGETDTRLAVKADTGHNHDAAYTPLTHVGTGGGAHATATTGAAGFLSAGDKTKLDTLSTTTPPAHIHDDRYYTESETDSKLTTKADTGHNHDATYTPVAHVGAGGAAHTQVTGALAGFMSAVDKTKLDGIQAGAMVARRSVTLVIAANDATAASRQMADVVCTGTDDQTAINTALATLTNGGRVILSEGTFMLGGAIVLASHTIIEGQGEATILKLADAIGSGMSMITNQHADTGKDYGIVIQHLAIDGNRAAQTATGWKGAILLKNAFRSAVVDCRVTSVYGEGIFFENGAFNRIERCHVEHCVSTGITIRWCDFTYVAHNLAYRNEEYGIENQASSGGQIRNNIVAGNRFEGIYAIGVDLDVCQNRAFLNGQISGTDHYNIYVSGRGMVIGNIVRDDFTETGGIGQGWFDLVQAYEGVNPGTTYSTSKGLYVGGGAFCIGNDLYGSGVNTDLELVSDTNNLTVQQNNRTTSTARTTSGTWH